MKLLTSLRTSSALWAAPLVLALTFFYYFAGGGAPDGDSFGYAPTIVAQAPGPTYAFAYAVSSSLAAWESGRLRKFGVWEMAPFRSRYRIAANALLPVLTLSWLMLILPVAMALLQTRVTPTMGSLLPLFSGLLLCLMHLVIGFGVGYWVPQFIAAPVLAAAVFYAVAFSVTTTSYWMRHVSGQFIEPVMFGEFLPFSSLLPPLVLAAGVALGIALLWLPFKLSVLRAGLAFIIATAAIVGARSLVDGWGASPPVAAGKAPMECVGNAPRVCMPRATASDIEVVRREAVSVLRDLRSAGVNASPELITDRLADGRYYKRSNRITWRVQLTYGDRDRDVRYRVLKAAVGFSCARPDPAISREVRLWAVKVTGEEKEYRRELKERQESFESSAARVAAVRERVNKVLALPKDEQRDWYRKSTANACEEP